MANLYIYTSGNPKSINSYSKNNECVFAPISSPILAKYAIYCDGTWLSTVGELKIRANAIRNSLSVSGLNYYTLDAQNNKIYIQYPASELEPASWDDEFYSGVMNIHFNQDPNLKINDSLELRVSPSNNT